MKKEEIRDHQILNGRVASIVRQLADVYENGADIGHARPVQEAARGLIGVFTRDLEKLTFPVRYADCSLYTSSDQMAARVVADGALFVWTGASDTALWTPKINWRFRAWHDALHHLVTGAPFDFLGELWAWRRAAAMVPQLAPLMFSEIVLQAAAAVENGDFAAQRVVAVPERLMRFALDSIPIPAVPSVCPLVRRTR